MLRSYNALQLSAPIAVLCLIALGGNNSAVAQDHANIKSYDPGSFRKEWINIVDTPNGMFFYNVDGSASVAMLHPQNGVVNTLKSWPKGGFRKGWSNVVAIPGAGIFFYDSTTGAAGFGRVEPGGEFVNMQDWPVKLVAIGVARGEFSKGWSHIVDTPWGVLFYSQKSASAALGRFDAAGNFTQIKAFAPGTFSQWNRIIMTEEGLFYHNSITGESALGRFDREGNHTTLGSFLSSAFGHDSTLVDTPFGVLNYQSGTGAAQLVRVEKRISHLELYKLTIVRNFPERSFTPHWLVYPAKGGIFWYSYPTGAATFGRMQ